MKNPLVRQALTLWVPLVLTYVIVLLLVQAGVVDAYMQVTIATICINIVLAVSLNLITGFTGQFSLGHAGFMAIGAYATALVTMRFDSIVGFIGGLLLGGIIAALVGFLIGLPTLRLRGDYIAIATLGMAEIIRILLQNFEFTNGAAGLSPVPQYMDWTWFFVLTVGSVMLIRNFVRSRQGRDAIAVREDEIAAESIGVNTTRSKVLAFTIGAFFGGVAGGMYASYFYVIKPEQFGFLKSIDILVIVVLGGLGSLSGSVIAAFLLAIISTLLQPFPGVRMILYALLLIVIMIFRPQGLLGNRELSLRLLPGLRKRRRDDAGTEAA
ncbi:branched-chain amino acid ABC transporter permease [Propioniciclava sinopodophylli]|uniref:Branched-chain amino acid ABC transporter permease n=1 Tax=Propioniciclava sinopodophylli TaxID=1837344 RepID=A0A4Q9KC47_9ACTN|nr:branched-chain amino acid ABC transporter permease [Propioniciclava sinopodophylli]TBT83721.1 branched-chain amino acid ABC transporter permease [Propioniciclava sinopodophylli]